MAKKYENPPITTTTTSTTTMKPTNDGDSDEDCEVYFLKPVNEYNITERIKEANKELFSNGGGITDLDSFEESAIELSNRKVTFALNLEDYEPSGGEEEAATSGATEASELHTKLARDFKFPAIEEEAEVGDTDSIKDNTMHDSIAARGNANAKAITNGRGVDEQLVEEICEEIVIMDMEEQTAADKRANGDVTETHKPQQQQHQRRHIVKQNTFAFEDDCVAQPVVGEEEDIEEITELTATSQPLLNNDGADGDGGGDNKSLTNLLNSDCEEDDRANREVIASVHQHNARDDDDADDDYDAVDDDEDDKLSIIVASYISDDYDCEDDYYDNDTKSLHTNVAAQQQQQHQAQKGGGLRAKLGQKSRRILPFGKRFSLRRKVNSGSGSAGNSSHGNSASRRQQQQQQQPLPEITDLKLNYKTCCEYRNAVQEKLPKYTGYLSEYGLSAAQLAQRAERMQRKQRHLLEQTLKANELELQKMHDNERAFTTWLRNKIRFFPLNKTRNMFDTKKGSRKTKTNSIFGGGGGSNSNVKGGDIGSRQSGSDYSAADAGGKQRKK